MRILAVVGLLILGLLPVVGRFLAPTLAWGFHHTAYLPPWAWMGSVVAWGVLLVPPLRRAVARLAYGPVAEWLFGRSAIRPVLAAVLAAAAFVLLATPVHLLGDGVLVGELASRGAPFRAHDAMDYLLHVQLIKALGEIGNPGASFRLYAIGSWIAGFLATLLALLLLRRSRLPQPTKVLTFSLWILAAPTLVYCGYAESYAFVSVAMLGFVWTGAMTQRGEIPPWVPGLLFGFALFFHTTALFAVPALLWLALWPGTRSIPRGAWARKTLAPALIGPILAVLFHLAAGYNEAWFRHEFLESKNQQNLLVALTGEHGFFSIRHAKDLANWILLAIPVTGWLIVAKTGSLRRRVREADVPFLLVQTVCFLVPFLLLDRKLGMARDWDLLTPQVAGFPWLAARLIESESQGAEDAGFLPPVRTAAPWVALLLVIPWLAVNASKEMSLQRFDEIRTDFPRFPRAYAAEELGKYYRDQDDFPRALVYYQECVETFPRNARTRILLGTIYLSLERLDEARGQYDTALEIDPSNWLALDMRAKLALREEEFETALTLFRRLAPMRSLDPAVWAGYGVAALQRGEFGEAHDAFLRSARIKLDPTYLHYAGLSAGHLGRWDEAIDLLGQALRIGGEDAEVLLCLARAHESRFSACLNAGEKVEAGDLRSARAYAARALELSPDHPRIRAYLADLDRVLGGQAEPANRLK